MSGTPDSLTGADTKDFVCNRTADGWPNFMEHYGRTIRRWCRRWWRLGAEEADDLTQLVVVKLFEKMQTNKALWDPAKGRFHDWLRTVTVRAWLDARSERQRCLGPGGKAVRELLENDAVCEDFVNRLAQAELIQLTQDKAQARVTPKEWEVYRLKIVERRSAEEVAGLVRLTVETIHNYTSKVRLVLREERARLEEPSEAKREAAT